MTTNFGAFNKNIDPNEVKKFLLSFRDVLVKKPWWQDGWFFGTFSSVDLHEIFVSKKSWKVGTPESSNYKIRIGVDKFSLKTITNNDPREPYLYIWVTEHVKKEKEKLSNEIIEHLKMNNKIYPGDQTKYKHFPLKRFGFKKMTPENEKVYFDIQRPKIIDFIDMYAPILGSKPLDDIISKW